MKCSFCQVIIQTADKRDSVRHLQKHKGEKINANTTKQLKELPLLFCDQCNYTCPQPFALKHHIKRVHSDEKHFTCSYINCNKSYAIIGDLRTHEATSHVRIKKFKCNVCAKKFMSKFKLNLHINQTHTLVGDYHCAQCLKNFRDKLALENHISGVHKKISFICPQCEKGFTWQGNLARHIKDVHEKEKKYACNFCEKRFSQKSSLKGHKQSVHIGERETMSEYFHGWSQDERGSTGPSDFFAK